MLKLLCALLVCAGSAAAEVEPDLVRIVADGRYQEAPFASLPRARLTTTNYHPNYVAKGPREYSGYRLRDILSRFKLAPDQPVTIVGKTGQFSVELKAAELMGSDVILATRVGGAPIQTADNGIQIVYGEKTLAKYPHLKKRQFWCWWVRTLVLDGKFKPAVEVKAARASTLRSPLPWPTPYGISSLGTASNSQARAVREIEAPRGLRVSVLNGSEHEVRAHPGSTLILTQAPSQKEGGFSVHEVQASEGQVSAFLSNIYYVQKVRAIP